MSKLPTTQSPIRWKISIGLLFAVPLLARSSFWQENVEVARQMGCNRRILYKYFPDLCSAIARIYKNYLQQSCEENLAFCCHQVQQIVAQLYRQGQYPSESRVAQLMDKPNFLRYGRVRSVLKLARSNCEFATTRLEL